MRSVEDLDHTLGELMCRAQAGDAKAYERLLGETARLVRDFARRRMTGSVDDVVQETLLSIHRYRHSYTPGRSFTAWTYGIARHRIVDIARRQQRQHRLEDAARTLPSSPISISEVVLDMRVVRWALAMLSARQRQIIELLKLEDRTVAEIATELGMSESAVKVTAHRGVRRLRGLVTGADDA